MWRMCCCESVTFLGARTSRGRPAHTGLMFDGLAQPGSIMTVLQSRLWPKKPLETWAYALRAGLASDRAGEPASRCGAAAAGGPASLPCRPSARHGHMPRGSNHVLIWRCLAAFSDSTWCMDTARNRLSFPVSCCSEQCLQASQCFTPHVHHHKVKERIKGCES